MASKVTLEDLARSSTSSSKSMQRVDTSSLGKQLEELHPEEVAAKKAKQEEEERKVTPELVNDAFTAMNATIEKKKKMAEEMVEKAQEVADEAKFEYEAAAEIPEFNEGISLEQASNDLAKELGEEEEVADDEDESAVDDGGPYDAELFDEDDEPEVVQLEDKVTVEDAAMTEPAEEVGASPEIEQLGSVEDYSQRKPVENVEQQHAEDVIVTASIGSRDRFKSTITDTSDIDSLLQSEDDTLENENSPIAETNEQLISRVKKSMKDVDIISNVVDLSQYKISESAVPVASILKAKGNIRKRAIDWPLLHTGCCIRVEECDGPELEALQHNVQTANDINRIIMSLRFVYNHIIDANKPPFEVWAKIVRAEDYESLYAAQHFANYANSNILDIRCEVDEKAGTGCGKFSAINIPYMSMLKFKDDEAKALFEELRQHDTTTPTKKLKTSLLQVSNDIVVSYSQPSLYDTFIQYSTLRQDIRDKYDDLLNMMAYIKGFFYINRQTHNLDKIKVPVYKNNINKTILAKLKVFTDVLKLLNPDQHNALKAKMNTNSEEFKVTYVIPEVTCPECGATIKERNVDSMINLLFMRAQLAQIKSL